MAEPSPAAALAAAHARLTRGDVAGAEAAVAAVLARHPRDAKALQLAGLVRRAAGDLTGARARLEASVAAGGGGEVLNTLGNVLGELGALDDADAAYARAAAADARSADPWINRGRLASRRGRHPAALAHLARAVALAPRSAMARVALGNAQRAAGDHDAAVATLRAAQALEPARGSTGVHLGTALTAAGRAREAIAAFDAAERAGDRSPQLIHNRAAARIAAGDLAGARADYDRLVAVHPAYLEGHRDRARLIHEFALEGDAFAGYRALAARHPREPAVWTAWLDALLSFRGYQGAIAVAEQAAAAIGETPATAFARAVALGETGDPAATPAFAALAPALVDRPGFGEAHARQLLRARDPAQAATVAEALVARLPDNQLGWAYLGLAWRLLDDPREAWLHDYDRHVGVIAAAPSADYLARAAAALRRLHVTQVHPADQSLRNGTQTPGALFPSRDPAVAAVEAEVRRAVAAFVAALPDDPAHPFLRRKAAAIDFAGSWSVRLVREGFHINHVHTQGWISSAYYFALPPVDPGDPDAGALQLGAPPAELELGLPPRRIVRPKVGRLALFPSSMWHGTVPFTTDAERLTVAFDIVPAGDSGR